MTNQTTRELQRMSDQIERITETVERINKQQQSYLNMLREDIPDTDTENPF